MTVCRPAISAGGFNIVPEETNGDGIVRRLNIYGPRGGDKGAMLRISDMHVWVPSITMSREIPNVARRMTGNTEQATETLRLRLFAESDRRGWSVPEPEPEPQDAYRYVRDPNGGINVLGPHGNARVGTFWSGVPGGGDWWCNRDLAAFLGYELTLPASTSIDEAEEWLIEAVRARDAQESPVEEHMETVVRAWGGELPVLPADDLPSAAWTQRVLDAMEPRARWTPAEYSADPASPRGLTQGEVNARIGEREPGAAMREAERQVDELRESRLMFRRRAV